MPLSISTELILDNIETIRGVLKHKTETWPDRGEYLRLLNVKATELFAEQRTIWRMASAYTLPALYQDQTGRAKVDAKVHSGGI